MIWKMSSADYIILMLRLVTSKQLTTANHMCCCVVGCVEARSKQGFESQLLELSRYREQTGRDT